MRYVKAACLLVCCMASGVALAQKSDSVATESRDQSLGYIGTTNFIVGRVGSECLAVLGRKETPQQYVRIWQQRNARYLHAIDVYMGMRLKEAEASGGEKARAALYQAMTAPARTSGAAVVQGWFRKDGKAKACRRVVALIDGGSFDFTPRIPIYKKLDEFATWAEKYPTVDTGFKVTSASFGLFDFPDKKLKFTPTNVVPRVPNQSYGWIIGLQTDRKTVKWREKVTLPARPATWGEPLPKDTRVISKDGRVAITEREVPVDKGVIYNVWTISPGDPKGHYSVQVSIQHALAASFEFDVR